MSQYSQMPHVPESETTERLTAAGSTDDSAGPSNEGRGRGSDAVKLKKELGLLEGVAIILGIIIGSGESTLVRIAWLEI